MPEADGREKREGKDREKSLRDAILKNKSKRMQIFKTFFKYMSAPYFFEEKVLLEQKLLYAVHIV